ncbi:MULTISPECIES: inner membrane protein YbjM [Pantoea]|uniref:inner membrane protein YbjM n=1 Tax=Pantoea TaxID=53335 RepID=UPI00257BCD6D|nr:MULTISPECIES: inner membrane protein YbjM [unclassified Pantoea]
MLQRSHRWSAFASGATLYTLVFIFAHHFWSVPLHMRHGQPELLLFLLPGVAIALLQPASPMVSTLWSAIAGTLLGMSWVMLTGQVSHTPLMGLAWSLSALFWAGCGALLVRLLRIMLAMRID